MTTKVTKSQDKTTLWIEYSPSDRNIVLITRSGMIIGINFWQGIDEDLFSDYNRADERLTRYVMPRVFARYDSECIQPYPDFEDMVEFIDNTIWDYQERDNDTIALNSIGHWLLGSVMYPMYKSDNGLILPCDYNDDERIHLDEITHWAFDQLSTHDWEMICERATKSATHRIEHLIFVGRAKPVEEQSKTYTIPSEQKKLIRIALGYYRETMEKIISMKTDADEFDIYDLRQLEGLMYGDLEVTLSAEQLDNFVNRHKVDVPNY